MYAVCNRLQALWFKGEWEEGKEKGVEGAKESENQNRSVPCSGGQMYREGRWPCNTV